MYDMYYDSPYLMHHGIKGMRWGVRRYQNRDGSLTSAGRNRYDDGLGRRSRRGGKKPLTAAQKAERKRKLIKGAKIAAAALGTAAVVGGTAYAMKKISARERAMANQDIARRERNARNEQTMRRQAEENARRTQFRNARLANERLRTEQDVVDYFQGTGRAGKFDTPEHNRRMRELEDTYAQQSFKDFNRRAGDANRSLGEAEARAREYRKGIQDNMRRLDDMENVMNRIEEEMRRRNNGR